IQTLLTWEYPHLCPPVSMTWLAQKGSLSLIRSPETGKLVPLRLSTVNGTSVLLPVPRAFGLCVLSAVAYQLTSTALLDAANCRLIYPVIDHVDERSGYMVYSCLDYAIFCFSSNSLQYSAIKLFQGSGGLVVKTGGLRSGGDTRGQASHRLPLWVPEQDP
ncbi:hypothetical protein ATANTOWER_001454, partial [Ataeniobius toweri]|nr:hypothetical protein [Ataeniobius toweri]